MKVPSHIQIEERLHRIEKALFISPPEGPIANTIYSGDGALTSARTIDLDGKILRFSSGVNSLLSIDPTSGGEVSLLQSYNTTGGDNWGAVRTSTDSGAGQFTLEAAFNGESTEAQINGSASAAGAGLEYTADSHIFNLGTNGLLRVVESSEGEYLLSLEKHNSFIQAIEGDIFSSVDLTASVSETAAVVQSKYDNGIVTKTASIEFFADSSQATLLYTADTHTFNAATNFEVVDPVSGAILISTGISSSLIRGFNPTDDNNQATLQGDATSTDATAFIEANFNDGVKLAKITAFADASSSTITHTADSHTFNGSIINAPPQIVFTSGLQSAIKMRSPDNTVYVITVQDGGTLQIVPD